MREVGRIDRICDLFNKVWKLNPDLRFFQLINIIQSEAKNDLFYLEDTEFERQLKDFVTKHNN